MRKIDADVLKTLFAPGGTYRTKSILHKIDAMPSIQPQEPRVMTLGEILTAEKVDIWREGRGEDIIVPFLLIGSENSDRHQAAYFFGPSVLPLQTYGKTWRCWTQRPTDEQREAQPWEN